MLSDPRNGWLPGCRAGYSTKRMCPANSKITVFICKHENAGEIAFIIYST